MTRMEALARELEQAPPIGVLLVDDEENVLKALRRLLLEEECEVLTATSGREGLDILKRNGNVGVIVSDQRMPEMTGVDFLEQARRVAPYAMKIMLTGYADIHATTDAINKGRAHRYMTKPWDDEEFLDVIRSAIDTYRLIQENRKRKAEAEAEQKNLVALNEKLRRLVTKQQEELRRKKDTPDRLQDAKDARFNISFLPIVDLLESREGIDPGHSRFVAGISTELCREMGLTSDEMESITLASLLHDMGKIGLPDGALVENPGQMSQEERVAYTAHPARGQRAIDKIGGFKEVGLMIRHHHEAFDGNGFPDRLKGEEIPLGARIVAMADNISRYVLDLQNEEAVERILGAVYGMFGKQFDPKLYPYLANLLRDRTSRCSLVQGRYIREFFSEDLMEGMELAMDIRSEAGMLLLKRGTIMSAGALRALKQHYGKETAKRSVFVYTQDNTDLFAEEDR